MQAQHRRPNDSGYALVALLVAMSVMAVMLSVALPVYSTAARREKEAELVFRGEQYARAISLFQRRFGNAIPPSVDALVEQKFLRKKFKDPITGDDFQVLSPGMPIPGQTTPPATATQKKGAEAQTRQQLEEARRKTEQLARTVVTRGAGGTTTVGLQGSVIGVTSKSTEKSLRIYNGRDKYNEWVFMGTQQSARAGGPPGAARPGGPGARGAQTPGPRGIGAQPIGPGGARGRRGQGSGPGPFGQQGGPTFPPAGGQRGGTPQR